jgi:hypothetical protein
MLRRHIAIAPADFILGGGDADQCEAHSVGIGKGQHSFAKALFQRLMGDPLRDETMCPVAERAGRYSERSLLGLADATAPRCGVLPWEECKDGAGVAGFIAIIEVIGVGIVEVDRLLDEAQP